MSLRITCPHCGERALNEWIYGEIPRVPEAMTDEHERDLDRAFMHDNVEGVVTEAWFHLYGCRRWVTIERDTSNDVVL